MRRRFIVAAVAALLAGLSVAACTTANQQVRYVAKPGVNLAGTQAALDQCRIASFKEIPQTMATDVQPGVSIPGRINCNTIGSLTTCTQAGGLDIPATAQTYDVNGPLRDRFMESACATQASRSPCCRSAGRTPSERRHMWHHPKMRYRSAA